MANDSTAEKISNALGRAQAVAFTTFSAALLVSYVMWASLAERQAQQTELNTELANLTDIFNRTDNAIREIRRYTLLQSPDTTDATAVRRIISDETSARLNADTLNSHLVKIAKLPTILKINGLLKQLTTKADANNSIDVDFTPQSIFVYDRIEQFRLRDLAVLTYLIAADPVALKPILETASRLEGEELRGKLIDVERELQIVADKAAKQNFDQMAANGDELRASVEQYTARNGPLVIGGLASSYDDILARVRVLESRRKDLASSLRGDYKVDVPMINQSMPVRLVVGLLPIGLIVGYGMVFVALAFARQQLKSITQPNDKKAAAKVGMIFDQLCTKWLIGIFSWGAMIVLFLLPAFAAAVIVSHYAATLSSGIYWAIWLPLIAAMIIVALIFHQAIAISKATL